MNRTRGNTYKLKEGKFRIDVGEVFHFEGGILLAQTVQRDCGWSVPGAVQDKVGWNCRQLDVVLDLVALSVAGRLELHDS